MGLSTPTLVTCVRPEKLSEGEFVNINKDNGCGKKHEDVPKKVTLAKSTTTKQQQNQPWRLRTLRYISWHKSAEDQNPIQN